MVQRPLGNTGVSVSPIAFGAFKIGRNERIKYAAGYPLPTDADCERLLNGVLDLGINLIDTAPAYGISEQRIGQFIAGRRDEYILSTKVGETFADGHSTYDFSREAVAASVQRSLQRLRTDRLDLVFVHSGGRDLDIIEQTDVVPTLRDLRDQGLVRFIGMSGKTVAGARAALGWADALMLEYHTDDRSHEPILPEAAERGVGVLIKKPLASGRISPDVAIPFLLGRTQISSVVIGSLSLEHVEQAMQIASAVVAA